MSHVNASISYHIFLKMPLIDQGATFIALRRCMDHFSIYYMYNLITCTILLHVQSLNMNSIPNLQFYLYQGI